MWMKRVRGLIGISRDRNSVGLRGHVSLQSGPNNLSNADKDRTKALKR